jgi:hypothetical protein
VRDGVGSPHVPFPCSAVKESLLCARGSLTMPLSSVLCLALWCKDSSWSDLHPVSVRGELPARSTSQLSPSLSACYPWPTPREADAVIFPTTRFLRLPDFHTICSQHKCLRCTREGPQPIRANVPHAIRPREDTAGHRHDRALLEHHNMNRPVLQSRHAAISSRGP